MVDPESARQDPQKYARDAELLLAEVERNPDDARSVFYLAQSYFDSGDFVNARAWYARRAEMGGWDEEVYAAMCRVAETMVHLNMPWPEVQDAYLKAWQFRPTRAEPLYAVARWYRLQQRYQLGYFFAERAAHIPFPEQDTLLVAGDVYSWRAMDEQAVCASWLGRHAEAFALCRRIVARPDVPDDARQRIAGNRDFSVSTMLETASAYPQQLVSELTTGRRDGEITISMIAGPDRADTEQTLNTFLNCCTDITAAARFLILDTGLSGQDRALLGERYGFVEFIEPDPAEALARIRDQVDTRYWLHLGQGWRFFAPEAYLTRLTAVLHAEPQVARVGINYADAAQPTGACAPEETVRRADGAGRYVLMGVTPTGPAMYDTTRLDQPDRSASAYLDEVLCSGTGQQAPSTNAGTETEPWSLPGASAYRSQLDSVRGWFPPLDFWLFDFILGEQLKEKITGDILEIGAFHGKSAILLGYGRRTDDRLVICDLFENDPAEFGSPTDESHYYTGLTTEVFLEQFGRFHDWQPELQVCPSSQLSDRIAGRIFRFIHVDGSHAYECVQEDIRTAVHHAANDTVIVFDDFRAIHTPGVAAAVWEAAAAHVIYPFCVSKQKLYATASRDAQQRWLKSAVARSKSGSPNPWQLHQILGLEVLQFWGR